MTTGLADINSLLPMTATGRPEGLGPWFAAHLVGGGGGSHMLVAHTQPHTLLLDARWVLASKVGPFDVWADCLAFVTQWRTNERLGRSLCTYYGRTHRLRWWQRRRQQRLRQRAYSIGDIKAACLVPKKK